MRIEYWISYAIIHANKLLFSIIRVEIKIFQHSRASHTLALSIFLLVLMWLKEFYD